MTAADGLGDSARTSLAIVTVNIRRNPNAPQFDRDLYTARISEYQPLNENIVNVRAIDLDDSQVLFLLLLLRCSFSKCMK